MDFEAAWPLERSLAACAFSPADNDRMPASARALMKAHQRSNLFSELLVDVVLRVVQGERLDPESLPIASPRVPSRTRAQRNALVRRLAPAMQVMGALAGVWAGRHGAGGVARASGQARKR
jgi:hypothetical protein